MLEFSSQKYTGLLERVLYIYLLVSVQDEELNRYNNKVHTS